MSLGMMLPGMISGGLQELLGHVLFIRYITLSERILATPEMQYGNESI
jgi:hypothetical protein